ncbi:MAG TPA: POTRA domain-containing protein [Acidobacteriaceae bacterium]|nr:POTRA domain-containing protein [Acidobacteriaceae bacterium]
MMGPLRLFPVPLCLALCLAVAPPGTAQSAQSPGAQSLPQTTPATERMLESYDGQNVAAIDIAGRPDLTTAQFQPVFTQKAGQPFSKAEVEATADALKARGHFGNVRIEVDPDPNGVRVLFILEPAVYFGIYRFPGAAAFAYSRLLQVANYPVQNPYSASEVERDRQALLRFYRQQGYFNAEVKTELEVDKVHDIANVVFRTTLGKKSKFGQVVIAGVPTQEQHQLEGDLKGIVARARQAAIRPGKAYHHSTLTHATSYLQGKLQKKGLLSAQVQLAGAEYHEQTNRADIRLSVKPGPVEKVEVTGAHLWSWDKDKLLPMYQGLGVDDETLQEGKQSLTSYFQARGYFDVAVDAQLKTGSSADEVIYRITRGKKHKVESVKVTGNKNLASSKLTPQIAVEQKHFFSRGKFSQELLRTSTNNLKAVYQSEGFSSVQIAPDVKNSDGNVSVTFVVTEGPRDVVASLKIEGANTFPDSQFAPRGLRIVAGKPYSGAHVVADRAEIMANYLRAGYLTASFRETALAASKSQPHEIDVVYHIYEGPRVRTGNVITLGREHTQPRLINRDIADLKPEQPLTETALLSAGARLYDHTGVFDWAEVDPRRQITTQNVEDVLVKVHEAKRNVITYGFGFEVINRGGSIPSGTVALPNLPPVGLPSNFKTSQTTFYGPRGTFEYTRNNVRGKDESLSFTAFAGRLDQRAAAYYIDPTFRWSPWKATTSLSYEKDEENPIFSSQQETGAFQVQRAIDHAQKDILFFRYGYSHTNITHVLIDALVPDRDRNIRLSTLAANLTRDTRDNPLDEHSGGLDSVELDFNTSKLGSNVDFTELTGQAAIYREKFHHIVWADSIRIGLAQPFNGSFVPLSQAFFTGGGNSLRGFPLDGAGPQNSVSICPTGAPTCSDPSQIRVPAGGNEELIINSEARIPLPIKKGLSIVPFYDGGNVFPRIGFHDFTSLYSNNVGLGLRYATPVGPIRFDIGQNLDPVSGIKSTNYFISIGQAF